MAAIDPDQEVDETAPGETKRAPRATLKVIRLPMGSDDDSEADSLEDDQLEALLSNGMSDEDDSSDDEEVNGGPSDPAKSSKARKEAALQALKDAIKEGTSKEDEKALNGVNGVDAKGKGKAISFADDDDEDMMDEDDESEDDYEEFVLCTLDPNQVRPQIYALRVIF